MQNELPPQARNIEILCPIITTAISYEKERNKEKVRIHDLAKSQCLRGQCHWFIVAKQKCAIILIAEGLSK